VAEIEEVVAAIREGRLAVIPTDTVYGLACDPARAEAVHALSQLKRRPPGQPIALVAAGVDRLLELVPELSGRAASMARGLLPGPYTLVLPNPARRFELLTGERQDTIGVRVPAVGGAAAELLERLGAVAATSANLHGQPDPRRLGEVPREIVGAIAATLDGGELPGTPSTVLDLTGDEPRILREGAIPATEALARVDDLLAE
jgi:L-threonylcarbamoyladenylate synthase